MLVERTAYWARPGQAGAVLDTRRRASDIRARLGLPRGAIVVKADPGEDGPDVSWECDFPTAEAHAADLAARGASAEFAAVRAAMQALIVRFERQLFRRDELPRPARRAGRRGPGARGSPQPSPGASAPRGPSSRSG